MTVPLTTRTSPTIDPEPESIESIESVQSIQDQVDPTRIFQGINIGTQTVTPATEHLPEDQRTLVRWLHFYSRREQWTWQDLCKHAGYSPTTWSRIFRDAYRYAKGEPRAGERMPIDDHCKAIARLKKLVEERESVRDTGFIETSVWERVNWLCRRAFVRKKIGFIWGESQIGKSTCVREYARRNNHGQTTYVEMPPSAGVQLMLRTIAEAINVPSSRSYEALLKDVAQSLDDSKVLILDEYQRVYTTYQKSSVMRCLDTVRYLHDKTGCGLVLVGTDQGRQELIRGEFSVYLKQLKRRGRTLMLQLPTEPPRQDLDLMAQAFNLPPATDEAEEKLLAVAKADGFGAVKMLLQDASERAAKKKRSTTWDDFTWAVNLADRMAQLETR